MNVNHQFVVKCTTAVWIFSKIYALMRRNHRPTLKISALPLHTAHIFSPHYSRTHHFGGNLMEQEHQTIDQNPAEENPTATAGAASSTGAATSGREPNFQQLMAASPTRSPLAGWLKCLRKPAISVEYSFQKRHVPDLDTDRGAASSGGGTATPGKNADTMGVGGSFTIRYFDFALGILGLAIVGCMTRGCRCLGRKLG